MRTPFKNILSIVLSVGLVGITSPPAFPWGNEGHRLVGDIAEAALKNDTKVLNHIHDVFGPSVRLQDLATCPDRIRDFVRANGTKDLDPACAPFIAKFSEPEGLLTSFPHSDKWHFINIPLNKTPHSLTDVKSFCGADSCAPERIEHYKAALAANASVAAKAEAILFLTHLVGDLHQPLHSAVRNNDAGGNAVIVTIFGKQFALHHVWDDEIIARMTDGNGHTLADESARSQHLAEVLPEAGEFNPWQWGLDAFQLAASTAYVNQGAKPAGSSIPDIRKPPGTKLHDAAYLAAADPVVQQQLRLAGVRLAAILRDKLNQ